MRNPNYVLGRGKLYFDQFLPDTKTISGKSRYLGNSPELSLSQEEETLDHYSADEGINVKDDSATLSNDMSGSFSLDDIHPENLAMWFRGAVERATVGAVNDGQHVVTDIKFATYVQLGLSDSDPIGARNVSNVSATRAGTAASGTLTISSTGPVADETVEIGGVEYTFKTVPVAPDDVLIGATISETATNLAAAINLDTDDNPFYATVAGAVVTVVAQEVGTDGNSITLVESATNIAVSGATLAGGSASGTTVIPSTGNFEVDAVTGRVFIVESPAGIEEGDDITFTYDAAAYDEEVVIAAGTAINGRMEFISANAKGENRDYIWPYVVVRPDGDFSLKGDEWQTMTFSLEILKLNDSTERQYIHKRPAAA